MDTGIKESYQNFLASDEVREAFISSTKASWSGGLYGIELFPDGRYRVQPYADFGNRYESPGLILFIPPLSEDEYDEAEDEWMIQNSLDLFQESFKDISEGA